MGIDDKDKCINIVYMSTIKNMTAVWKYEIISNKIYRDKMFTLLK
jgi:hypothetical protein